MPFFSLYVNQEAVERAYFVLAGLAFLAGSYLLGFFFVYIALGVDEEDRTIEEDLLDSSEPQVLYAFNVQKDIASQHFASQGTIFSDDPMQNARFAERFIIDDYIYERDMFSEIYEVPATSIISNNSYIIPYSEESKYLSFMALAQKRFPFFERERNLKFLKLRNLEELGPSFRPPLLSNSLQISLKPRLLHQGNLPSTPLPRDAEEKGRNEIYLGYWFWPTNFLNIYPLPIEVLDFKLFRHAPENSEKTTEECLVLFYSQNKTKEFAKVKLINFEVEASHENQS